jgi:hypothetical protein
MKRSGKFECIVQYIIHIKTWFNLTIPILIKGLVAQTRVRGISIGHSVETFH